MFAVLVGLTAQVCVAGEALRTVHPVGPWRVTADPGNRGLAERWFEPGRLPAGRSIQVPGEWESVLGLEYDGVGWYRARLAVPSVGADQRLVLRFDAVATDAQVWIDGRAAGGHVGPWTRFDCDITDLVEAGGQAEVVVRVDEKVGHNTQGFLPIVAPHFGGIWQPVGLWVVPAVRLDDQGVFIDASDIDPAAGTGTLRVEGPVVGKPRGPLSIRVTLRDGSGRTVAAGDAAVSEGLGRWTWRGPVRLWGVGTPALYDVSIALLDAGGATVDWIECRTGFRRVEADGSTVRLNGRKCIVRGVLDWGLAPPGLAPRPAPEWFRERLRYLKACGFNLIKFCLWMPPEYVLRIVDEEGMLAWVEYPTWHPQIDAAHRQELVREYREMTAQDGHHPSVVLRSLTCETGPSADLDVLRALYALVKQRCPGTLVVDDSSWIGWNRVHDFWDDHAYGNNRSWRGQLGGFRDYIREHGVKPFIMGEAIAADTWPDAAALEAAGAEWGWCLPRWLDAQKAFEADLRARFGDGGYDPVADVRRQSLRYAIQMRRWQIETYRHEMPDAGYVVSTMRDVKLCAMGLLDMRGRPKWSMGQWGFHGALVTPLNTMGDCRGFRSGGVIVFEPCYRVDPTGPGDPVRRVRWSLGDQRFVQGVGGDGAGPTLRFDLPRVDRPRAVRLERVAVGADGRAIGPPVGWTLWVLPDPPELAEGVMVVDFGDAAVSDLFEGAGRLEPDSAIDARVRAVVTTAMTEPVLAYLRDGGRVLHLASDRSGSFKTESTWFLRGTAWAPRVSRAFSERCPAGVLQDLQNFELGADGVIRGELLWEQVDPLLTFIETHDLTTVRPNLLLFATTVGRGRLVVSALRHTGGAATNYAGWWLARVLVDHLVRGPAPGRGLDASVIDALWAGLAAEDRPVDPVWRFRKDPENVGVERGFFRVDFDDGDWQRLRARSAEEGRIWAGYDGWGWYRCRVPIDAGWKGRPVRIVFDSVDDMYRLYVNGREAGGHGRMDRSETSYLQRTWVDVSDLVEPGRENTLVVRVYDWVGAGGLNGAIRLTTGPVGPAADLIRR